MPPKVAAKSTGTAQFTAEDTAIRTLIELTKTSQALLAHFQSSLNAPTAAAAATQNGSSSSTSSSSIRDPLSVIKDTTTLLRSHTTTLSLLLLTPPFSASAVSKKIGDVSSGVLTGMVAAATAEDRGKGGKDTLGELMRVELRAQVRRVMSSWGDVLALVLRFAEARSAKAGADGVKKRKEVNEAERQDVLSTTGVVWEGCDRLIKVCEQGVVGLVVRKAEEWRAVLLDAVAEIKEWGEDVDDDEEEDSLAGSGDEDDEAGFKDEDDIFGAANKLGKEDKELKALLDTSVKKLKMVGVLYQALIKRRLKTFPASSFGQGEASGAMEALEKLMVILKSIPESVDDLASAFYDLDEDEARKGLEKCCNEAAKAIGLVRQSWTASDDEFTAWSGKWLDALANA